MKSLLIALVIGLFSTVPAEGKPDYQAAIDPQYLTITYNPGGYIDRFRTRWRRLAQRGENVDIVGPCLSACTLVMSYVPESRICFGPHGSLGFHLAYYQRSDGVIVPARGITQRMVDSYPADIRAWINARGGVRQMSIDIMWMLSAPELWAMGYRRCA